MSEDNWFKTEWMRRHAQMDQEYPRYVAWDLGKEPAVVVEVKPHPRLTRFDVVYGGRQSGKSFEASKRNA